MHFELRDRAQHTGTEEYQVSFVITEQHDLYDVRGFGVQFKIRPEIATLVWERFLSGGTYGPWRRVHWSRVSAIKGPRVLKSGGTTDKQQGVVKVFVSADLGGRLSDYASGLPHLQQMIEELERNLPQ